MTTTEHAQRASSAHMRKGAELDIIVETLDWRGFLIEVRYEARWLGDPEWAHLDIETLEPRRAPLPITETGYRSHFASRTMIEAAGGPSNFVRALLDEAGSSRGWINAELAARQYTLL